MPITPEHDRPQLGEGPDSVTLLAEAHEFGSWYTKSILELAGTKPSTEVAGNYRNEAIESSVRRNTRRQAAIVRERSMSARDMLAQAYDETTYSEVLAAEDTFRVEEPSSGMYVIHAQPEQYEKLRAGSQAVAVKVQNGISFVLINDLSGKGDEEYRKRYLSENIPHELHHIVWFFLMLDGYIKKPKESDHIERALAMFKDELIARLLSDGGVMGYSHLSVMSPERREATAQEDPITVRLVYELVVQMNECLEEIERDRRKTDVRKEDLIKAVWDAQTFDELRNNLLKMHAVIKKQPVTRGLPQVVNDNGWDTIRV